MQQILLKKIVSARHVSARQFLPTFNAAQLQKKLTNPVAGYSGFGRGAMFWAMIHGFEACFDQLQTCYDRPDSDPRLGSSPAPLYPRFPSISDLLESAMKTVGSSLKVDDAAEATQAGASAADAGVAANVPNFLELKQQLEALVFPRISTKLFPRISADPVEDEKAAKTETVPSDARPVVPDIQVDMPKIRTVLAKIRHGLLFAVIQEKMPESDVLRGIIDVLKQLEAKTVSRQLPEGQALSVDESVDATYIRHMHYELGAAIDGRNSILSHSEKLPGANMFTATMVADLLRQYVRGSDVSGSIKTEALRPTQMFVQGLLSRYIPSVFGNGGSNLPSHLTKDGFASLKASKNLRMPTMGHMLIRMHQNALKPSSTGRPLSPAKPNAGHQGFDPGTIRLTPSFESAPVPLMSLDESGKFGFSARMKDWVNSLPATFDSGQFEMPRQQLTLVCKAAHAVEMYVKTSLIPSNEQFFVDWATLYDLACMCQTKLVELTEKAIERVHDVAQNFKLQRIPQDDREHVKNQALVVVAWLEDWKDGVFFHSATFASESSFNQPEAALPQDGISNELGPDREFSGQMNRALTELADTLMTRLPSIAAVYDLESFSQTLDAFVASCTKSEFVAFGPAGSLTPGLVSSGQMQRLKAMVSIAMGKTGQSQTYVREYNRLFSGQVGLIVSQSGD